MKIRIVVATRQNQDDFSNCTATGKSLSIYKYPFLEIRLFPNNKVGLPEVYNLAIEESIKSPALLVFAHDDLHLLDYHWVEELERSLLQFQILGLAGNKRRMPRQPAWFLDEHFQWDMPENLSGAIGHGKSFPPTNLSNYGAPHQEVKLLDGLWLACLSTTLVDSNLRFDERFDFDFYDLDFCRQAEIKQLKMGTCAISAIHESGGNFNTEQWRQAYNLYLDKWGD